MIEHGFVRAWGWLLALATNGLLFWVGWSLRKKFMTREDCAIWRTEISQAHERLARLLATHEASVRELTLRLETLPGMDALHSMEVRQAEIQGEQARLAEEVRGLREIMRRVECQTELLYRDRLEEK